jgi:hypothetical protein
MWSDSDLLHRGVVRRSLQLLSSLFISVLYIYCTRHQRTDVLPSFDMNSPIAISNVHLLHGEVREVAHVLLVNSTYCHNQA